MNGSSAFDRLAASYDADFSDRLPAQWLRQRVRERAGRYLPGRARVLDVGCGTGEDAMWLAREGHTVVASDVSPDMLARTRDKAREAPAAIGRRISVVAYDAAGGAMPEGTFDAVWSNFGALNCVADPGPFLAAAADRLRPGGVAALVLMGPFCLWETIGFALKGDLRRARRRWRGRGAFEAQGARQDVWYHPASRIAKLAAARFTTAAVCGIGVFVPPTEFFGVCERRPALLRSLANVERALGAAWPFSRLGDHYLIVLRRSYDGGAR